MLWRKLPILHLTYEPKVLTLVRMNWPTSRRLDCDTSLALARSSPTRRYTGYTKKNQFRSVFGISVPILLVFYVYLEYGPLKTLLNTGIFWQNKNWFGIGVGKFKPHLKPSKRGTKSKYWNPQYLAKYANIFGEKLITCRTSSTFWHINRVYLTLSKVGQSL